MPVFEEELVGVDGLLVGLAGVQPLVHAVVHEPQSDLDLFLNRLRKQLDVEEVLLVLALAPIAEIHAARVVLVVHAALFDEFANDLLGVRLADVAVCDDGIGEEAQLAVLEPAFGEIVAVAAVLNDVDACVFEIIDVSRDRLAFALDAVLAREICDDVRLFEFVVRVRILVEDLIDPEDEQFFWFKAVHNNLLRRL